MKIDQWVDGSWHYELSVWYMSSFNYSDTRWTTTLGRHASPGELDDLFGVGILEWVCTGTTVDRRKDQQLYKRQCVTFSGTMRIFRPNENEYQHTNWVGV